jgi:hypothetical protein
LTNWSRKAPPCATIVDISACGSLPAVMTERASCRPSGQPSVSPAGGRERPGPLSPQSAHGSIRSSRRAGNAAAMAPR